MAFIEEDGEGQIKVNEWKDVLHELTKFNGISYNCNLKEIVAYKNEFVSHVYELVLPKRKWEDSHVQGKSRICEKH